MIDDDRYPASERQRDRDRYGRRERDSRGRPAPPPPPSDDRHRTALKKNVPTGPRADRSKTGTLNGFNDYTAPSSSMPPPPLPRPSTNGTLLDSSEPFVPPMSEQDLTAIRSRYLGADKKKRKIRKMNDRKFVFDWDTQDDTFAEDSPVATGSNRQGAQIMFGRGHLAGMDDSGGSGVRRVTGEDSNNLADAMERRKAAKSGIDERHWTEKPLGEMKERDWRIFREDFSISARGINPYLDHSLGPRLTLTPGGNIPHPLRSWTESEIPQTILECIERIGYKEPSPIQRQAIPIGLQNRDIIGIAETGTVRHFHPI